MRESAVSIRDAPLEAYQFAQWRPLGGLIERGDIHRAMQANPDLFGGAAVETLNPDELADTVWRLYADRQDAEAVVNTLRV
jgi:hypothetical protein